jgi:hypothetical protein
MMKNTYKILSRKTGGESNLEGTGVDERIILK